MKVLYQKRWRKKTNGYSANLRFPEKMATNDDGGGGGGGLFVH